MQEPLKEIILQEDTLQELEPYRDDEIKNLLQDLEVLRDLLLEFNILTNEQRQQLSMAVKKIAQPEPDILDNVELDNILPEHNERRYEFMRVMAVLGGGGLGIAGFLLNPLVGLGTMLTGSGAAWLLTRTETVDTILDNLRGILDHWGRWSGSSSIAQPTSVTLVK